MDIPSWADEDLSRQLSVIRDQGEGQLLEFIECFPSQVRELGKEIAAMASSGGGRILLGVKDDGGLIGLAQITGPRERDELIRRVEAVTGGTIQPAITPKAMFGWEEGQTVLCISVPRRSQPVYYCQGKPYIRHLTESRPAQPHEVVDLVLKWAGVEQSVKGEQVPPGPPWIDVLDTLLVELLIAADEFSERDLKPWLDQLDLLCQRSAQELRQLVHEQLSDEPHLSESLRRMAAQCDEVTHQLKHLRTTSFPKIEEILAELERESQQLKEEFIDDAIVSEDFLEESKGRIRASARSLRDLSDRSEAVKR